MPEHPFAHDLSDAALAASLGGGFTSAHADVNGTRLHYVEGGSGEPVVLLGGWPQTWWQWHKVLPELALHHRVVAVDLRGMGGSAKPPTGYDKKTMAADVHALLAHLGIASAHLVGHDIGAMVAHAHAANHPGATRSLALLDVTHPDDGWAQLPLLPQDGRRHLWWFAFNQVHGLPEALLAGRYHLLLDWLFTHGAADPDTVDARSRAVYARAYDDPEAVRAGNDWYRAFPQDIADLRTYGPVTVPVLGLGGDRSNYEALRAVVPGLGADTRVVRVKDCGHYLPEEQPEAVLAELLPFLGGRGRR
ncbi:alpha/beta fold hydrolase [Streptomyces antimicrobicus]|uniref:Alpha/beta hydrolase n=1 Tax=Streptomyces antimicrobicus TaxID=2883108 RepID=A0ABS8BAZ7_9ACTN|nr:alpha/beta hydrolase [Streptomyces antimicrobicus]MCB5181689.1 alpha/beta hydrolase [Streptomyces antimicrobicus]